MRSASVHPGFRGCSLTRLLQSFLLLTLAFFEQTVYAQQYNQAQMRVYEKVDRFLTTSVNELLAFAKYYDLGGFPNGLEAADRAQARRYMYSLLSSLNKTGLKPFYGLEDGTLGGYWHGALNQVPGLVYREPGNSGYSVAINSTDDLLIHYNVCLNETNGENVTCTMDENRPLYISCNDDCEMIPCGGNSMVLCQDYDILEFKQSDGVMGFVPTTMNCMDSDGAYSQTPGEILNDSPEGIIYDGSCTFGDGTLVTRELEGPFAVCGKSNNDKNGTENNVCSTAFVGANRYMNYDPRWRGWYIDSKNNQVPRFSDPYIFFTFGSVGITYTHPIYKSIDGTKDGQKIFHGVLAVDMELSDVTNFLKTKLANTNFTVTIYEFEDPYYIIASSTSANAMGSVLKDNGLERCPEGQEESSACESGRLTIDNFQSSTEDAIVRKAHHAMMESENDENFNKGGRIAVSEDDDNVASTSYLVTSLIYDKLADANLKWRIVVATPIDENPDDFIEEGGGLFILLCSVCGAGFTLCMLLFFAFYRRKNEKAVQLADFQFTSAFILGCAGMNLSFFAYVGKPTDQMCLSRIWAFFMLSTLLLSPLFVKVYRSYCLLGRPVAMAINVNINNREAWMRTIPIILIQIIILLIATFVDPPKVATVVDLDDDIIIKSMRCKHDKYIFFILQASYDFLLLALGCCLVYLTRNIDPRFCDTKALSFAMYNISFTMLMLGLIIAFVDVTEVGRFSLQYIGVFWASVFSAAAFVVPRLMTAKTDRKKDLKKKKRLQSRYASERQSRIMMESVVNGASVEDGLHESEESLKLLICAANMGNAPPTLESMKAFIPEAGSCHEVTPSEEDLVVKDNYDLIVIGMQEATWGSKKQRKSEKDGVASTLPVDTKEPDDDEVSLEEARAKEDNYRAAIEGADTVLLQQQMKEILGSEYTSIASEQRGQMRQFIYARSSVAPLMKNVKISGENTGIGNVLNNKGGIIVSMTYQDTRMTFLSAHLAAHEGDNYYKARCDNVYDILKGSSTFDISKKESIDLAICSHHVFVCGDLNFRTKFEGEHTHEEKFQMATDLIKAENWNKLYSYDELHQGINRNDLLVNFETLPCEFNPTFKVNRCEGYDYKDQRVPSYTDRILFKSAPNLSDNLRQIAYEPCEDFVTSDHKPIRGAFSLVPNDMVTARTVEGKYRLTFTNLECSDLRAADVSGTSDPYIKFIWDSVEMSEDNNKINFKFWQPGKDRFPKTSRILKNLNPKWPGKTITLTTLGSEISVDALLYICVYDKDVFLDDDILGTLCLSVQQLIAMDPRDTTKEMLFDHSLESYGKFEGRIKFSLQVSQLVG